MYWTRPANLHHTALSDLSGIPQRYGSKAFRKDSTPTRVIERQVLLEGRHMSLHESQSEAHAPTLLQHGEHAVHIQPSSLAKRPETDKLGQYKHLSGNMFKGLAQIFPKATTRNHGRQTGLRTRIQVAMIEEVSTVHISDSTSPAVEVCNDRTS